MQPRMFLNILTIGNTIYILVVVFFLVFVRVFYINELSVNTFESGVCKHGTLVNSSNTVEDLNVFTLCLVLVVSRNIREPDMLSRILCRAENNINILVYPKQVCRKVLCVWISRNSYAYFQKVVVWCNRWSQRFDSNKYLVLQTAEQKPHWSLKQHDAYI